MIHTVRFYPAFDDMVNGCEHEKKGDHGRGAVRLTMASQTGGYAVVWEIGTNWQLPETYEEGRTIHGGLIDWSRFQGLSAGVVDFHSSRSHYEGQNPVRPDCQYLKGPCYLDSGCLISDELEDALLRGGDKAVWPILDRWLAELVEGE